MTPDQLLPAARQVDWPEEHLAWVLDATRPSIDILLTDEAPAPAASRFGGLPFAPPGFSWPAHETGRYRFLGQIDLAQCPPSDPPFPTSGLLAFFYADDDEGEVFWQDDGYVIAFHWPDVSDHVLLSAPDDVPVNPEAAFDLAAGLNLCRHEELRDDWPFEGSRDYAWDLAELVNAEHYLLGHPSYTTLAYDPTPGPEWTPLLTLGSSPDLDWSWHDGDRLMVFIRAEDLRAGNFGALRCDAG